MAFHDIHRNLTGVFGFPITPFRKDLSLDLDGLARNVAEMSKHPFCALVAAGGTGELYSLTPEEIGDVVRVTVENSGGLPVVAGTGYSAAIGSDIACRAARAGAASLLILPPYYISAPEEGLFDYYAAIGHAVELPLMIYSRDWVTPSPQQVARLCERIPTLTGWKDGQGDGRKYQRIMNYVGDRLAWFGGLGDDTVPVYFAVGVQAYTSSISNIAPKLSLALAKAGMARDFATLDGLMKKYVHPLYALRERMRGYEVSIMKEAMTMLGMAAGPVRPPLCEVRPQDREDLKKLIDVYRDVLEA
jgi:5-dehydro-4-deoxyglucarate dehydratase